MHNSGTLSSADRLLIDFLYQVCTLMMIPPVINLFCHWKALSLVHRARHTSCSTESGQGKSMAKKGLVQVTFNCISTIQSDCTTQIWSVINNSYWGFTVCRSQKIAVDRCHIGLNSMAQMWLPSAWYIKSCHLLTLHLYPHVFHGSSCPTWELVCKYGFIGN